VRSCNTAGAGAFLFGMIIGAADGLIGGGGEFRIPDLHVLQFPLKDAAGSNTEGCDDRASRLAALIIVR
jgi:hypothetical protein